MSVATRAVVRALVFIALLLTDTHCLVTGALAQDYPSRLIRVIVPQSPGSAPDLVARIAGPEMGKSLGQASTFGEASSFEIQENWNQGFPRKPSNAAPIEEQVGGLIIVPPSEAHTVQGMRSL